MSPATDPRVEALLAGIPAEDRTRLVDVRDGGAALWERVLGTRPHSSALYRYCTVGSRGVRLASIERGNRRPCTCALWVAEWAVAVSAARGAQPAPVPSRKKGAARRSRRRAASKSASTAKSDGGIA